MKSLNWPGKEVKLSQPVDYEQAYMKAALEGRNNADSALAYKEMFGLPPKSGTPYWLVRLAIYYGGLEIGHRRCKSKFTGVDASFASLVQRLDENELRNNKVMWHKMYLHDVEDAEFGGMERVV